MRELLSIFCVSYLLSTVLLLPAYLLCFFIDSRHVLVHQLHNGG